MDTSVVSSPVGISGAVTPLVDMPLFLLVMLVVSAGAFIMALVTRESRAYSLGPSFGRTVAVMVSWLPILLMGIAALFFAARLLRVFFGS